MLCSWSLATQDVVLGVAVSVVLASTGFFCFYWFRLPSECTRSISPGRSVLVDNLKGVLILTIVWGHVTAIPTLIVPQEAFVWGPALAWSSMFHMCKKVEIPAEFELPGLLSHFSPVCARNRLGPLHRMQILSAWYWGLTLHPNCCGGWISVGGKDCACP
mmetsp:Transcript_100161/g.229922  ORF Transcript_100161/g.229922 Transcript_100161/m.229922 type:complete len:160 (-) Transcript_100161:855-1334(-)